jgi:transcriptional regulator with XRE-family HTH domain
MKLQRDKEFIEKFGKNLQKIRKSKGVSQETLAIKLNTDRMVISKIERGITNPTIGYVKAISDVLNVEVSSLFQFD